MSKLVYKETSSGCELYLIKGNKLEDAGMLSETWLAEKITDGFNKTEVMLDNLSEGSGEVDYPMGIDKSAFDEMHKREKCISDIMDKPESSEKTLESYPEKYAPSEEVVVEPKTNKKSLSKSQKEMSEEKESVSDAKEDKVGYPLAEDPKYPFPNGVKEASLKRKFIEWARRNYGAKVKGVNLSEFKVQTFASFNKFNDDALRSMEVYDSENNEWVYIYGAELLHRCYNSELELWDTFIPEEDEVIFYQ
jgi:hypothetical protein